mgnify:CR=1 FL=1
MAVFGDLYNDAKQIAAAVSAAILGLLYLNRRRSQDQKANHSDKASSSLLDQLIVERQTAFAEIERQKVAHEQEKNEIRAAYEKEVAEQRQEIRILQEELRVARESALRNAIKLEHSEKAEINLQTQLMRVEADIAAWRKRVKKLAQALNEMKPGHSDIQDSDFSDLT